MLLLVKKMKEIIFYPFVIIILLVTTKGITAQNCIVNNTTNLKINDIELQIGTDTLVVAQMANRKMCNILKYIKLKQWQIPILFKECYSYQKSIDSALISIANKYDFGQIHYTKDSIFDSAFFSLLTDSQEIAYIRNKGWVDVEIKTNEKMRYLEEADYYKNEELRKMRIEIFNYIAVR